MEKAREATLEMEKKEVAKKKGRKEKSKTELIYPCNYFKIILYLILNNYPPDETTISSRSISPLIIVVWGII